MLVRSHGGKYGGRRRQGWLLIKERDDEARTGADREHRRAASPKASLTGPQPRRESRVRRNASGIRTKSVAANVKAGAVAPFKRSGEKGARRPRRTMPNGARRAQTAGDPMSAQLATLVDEAPAGPGGCTRSSTTATGCSCRIASAAMRDLVAQRQGVDGRRFPASPAPSRSCPVKSAWLDGEIVMPDANGATSFQALQNALSANAERTLIYFAFDLMQPRRLRLARRAARRAQAAARTAARRQTRARVQRPLRVRRRSVLAEACALGLEGIVSKREDARTRRRGRAAG